MTERHRRAARWQGALLAAGIVSLLALMFGAPELFVLAIVALGFVLVSQLSTSASPGSLSLERSLEASRLRPGQSVRVTVSVTNDGERVVPDVRIVDSPPVPATRGSPAIGTAIRPGETIRYTYELTPPRGAFEFGPVTLRVRSVTGTAVTTTERTPAGDDSLTCETVLDSFPFDDQTIQFVGRTPTDDGGSGIEFYATREYRRGDPINRIDWHRFARTGDLATVEYRTEQAVTTVFVIDDRTGAHRDLQAPHDDPALGPDSFDLTLYAASRGVIASLEEGNRTGLTTLEGAAWVEPGTGDDTSHRMQDVLAADDGRVTPQWDEDTHALADGGSLATNLERRLPARAQVVLCTPLTDSHILSLVERLRMNGRAVLVISPDITTGIGSPSSSTGARIARLERANRCTALRLVGATVVDWNLEEPLSVELTRTLRAVTRGRRA